MALERARVVAHPEAPGAGSKRYRERHARHAQAHLKPDGRLVRCQRLPCQKEPVTGNNPITINTPVRWMSHIWKPPADILRRRPAGMAVMASKNGGLS